MTHQLREEGEINRRKNVDQRAPAIVEVRHRIRLSKVKKDRGKEKKA